MLQSDMSCKRQQVASAGSAVEKTASLIYTARNVRTVYSDGNVVEE
jgi:hypothetical protein